MTTRVMEAATDIVEHFTEERSEDDTFRIGHASTAPLVGLGATFSRLFTMPGICLRTKVAGTEHLLRSLRDGELDLAIIDRPLTTDEAEMHGQAELISSPFVAVRHKRFSRSGSLEDEPEVGYVSCGRTSYHHAAVSRLRAQHAEVNWTPLGEVDAVNFSLRFAPFVDAVFIVPEFALQRGDALDFEVLITGGDNACEMRAVWNAQKPHRRTQSVVALLSV